jgi:hypothetical protein
MGLISRIYRILKNIKGTNNPINKRVTELRKQLSKEKGQMGNIYRKKCITSLGKRTTQIKTPPRFHLFPVRWLSSRKQSQVPVILDT